LNCDIIINMNHVIESQQFGLKFINKIFSIADKLEKKTDNSLKGKIMASLFYERVPELVFF